MDNTPITLSTTITSIEKGIRLDRFLAERFSYQSRHRWQQSIRKGELTVNNRIVKPSYEIKINDIIDFTPEEYSEPPVNKNFSIIYQDNVLLICNKPADLPVHPSGPYRFHTLLTLLENKVQQKLYPLHRLDRETSGVIAFCTDPVYVHKALSYMKQWKKKYYALIHGRLEKEITIDIPIGKDETSQVRKKRAAYSGASEKAETFFRPIEQLRDSTLVEAIPVTGRLHQIRVHSLYMGHHILGDRLYGEDENLFLSFIEGNDAFDSSGMKRVALHAHELTIVHPENRKNYTFHAPMPGDMMKYIEQQKE